MTGILAEFGKNKDANYSKKSLMFEKVNKDAYISVVIDATNEDNKFSVTKKVFIIFIYKNISYQSLLDQ